MFKKTIQMSFNFKKNAFALILGVVVILAYFTAIFLYKNTGLICEENRLPFSDILKIVFAISFLVLGFFTYFQSNSSLKQLFSARNLLIISLLASMVSTIFKWNVSAYSVGVYVFFTLVYFLRNKELYALNKVFYFIFAFALLRLFGTIRSAQGFYFPDKILTFFLLPISYTFFFFERTTLLKVLKLFFRSILFYMVVSLLFWFFNYNHLEIQPIEWMTSKVMIEGRCGFEFVAGWSGYYIPTFISLVLLTGLVSGFYLYLQKDEKITISTLELLLYVVLCLIVELALESRIGVASFLFVVLVNVVYYVKIKSFHFKKILVATIVISIGALFYMKDLVNRLIEDEPRRIVYTLSTSYIKDNIWWGAGTYQQLPALLSQEEKMPDVERIPGFPPYLHSHNQLLGEMVQFGVFGGLVFLVVLIALFYFSFKTRNYLLQMLMMIFVIAMLIDEPWYMQESVIAFNVLFAFFVALNQEKKIVKSFRKESSPAS